MAIRGWTIALVIALVVPVSARGQNASPPVRERLITQNFAIKVPTHPCIVPGVVMFVARNVEAVSGVEYRPEPCDYRTPLPENREEIDLLGMTVEQAMNTLVKIDPRYAWQESTGVIMLRPLEAWADEKHILHEAIGPIEFENKTMGYALNQLRPITGHEPMFFLTSDKGGSGTGGGRKECKW